MFLPALLQTFSMENWVADVVLTCQGKEYRRTIGTNAVTEAEARKAVIDSLCAGRRKLPEDHWMARPAITITDMKICKRHEHPRFKNHGQPLSTIELLAKGN